MMLKRIALYFSLICFMGNQVAMAGPTCGLIPNTKVCVDSTPCKQTPSGVTTCLAGVPLPTNAVALPQSCWQYQYQFACAPTTPDTTTCGALESNPSCGMIKSTCTDTVPETGLCDAWLYTYQCLDSQSQASQQTVCSAGGVAVNALPTPNNSNQNFANAALGMEIAREVQIYQQNGLDIFKGVQETCTKGYFGLKNCCKSAPGAKNNSMVTQMAIGSAATTVKYLGQSAVDLVSPYAFDAMYSSGMFTEGFTSMVETSASVITDTAGQAIATNFAASGLTLGAYGFTFGTGVAVESATTFTLLEGSWGFVAFNPYMFVAMVAIQIVMSLMECSDSEQMLAMHKGANLSQYIKTDCKSKVFGVCVEYKDTYCSFNTVLAKIVNIQGKQQLGMDISNCAGLSVQDITRIDFRRLDMSQFTQEILAQTKLPTSNGIKANYSPVMQQVPQGSAQSTNKLLSY